MWLVIGMALLRDRSIREVVRHLDLVLPARAAASTVSGAAIAQARERLGPEPLAALFAQTAAVWGAGRGRRGALARPDRLRRSTGRRCASPIPRRTKPAFGRVPTRWESTGGYPVLRLVALMVLRQHVLTAAGPRRLPGQ